VPDVPRGGEATARERKNERERAQMDEKTRQSQQGGKTGKDQRRSINNRQGTREVNQQAAGQERALSQGER